MEYYGYKDIDLIPELLDWKKLNGDSFSVEEWGDAHLTPELIIGFSHIYFPKFAKFENGVFFANSIPNLKKQRESGEWKNLDTIELQYLFNHQHVLDYFVGMMGESYDKISRKQLECVGKILVDIWGMKLRSDFPDLNLHIELQGLDSEGYLEDIVVVFWAK